VRLARLALFVIATSVGVWLIGTNAAYAATGYGGGSLGSGGVTAVGAVPGDNSTPAAGSPAGAGSSTASGVSYTDPPPNPPTAMSSPYTWQLIGSDLLVDCGPGGQVTPSKFSTAGGTGLSLGPGGAAGLANLYVLMGPSGVVTTKDVCATPTAASGHATLAAAAAPPPPPPPPPTPAEVWSDAPLPVNHIAFNPATLGLTQLPTWIWFTGPNGAIHATVTIRGYTVTTTASPVAAYWTFGDGGSAKGSVGGSEAQPSVTHTYVNIGHYTVTLIVAWSGQFTFAGHGVPAQTVALGTVDGATTAAPYAVQEVRSVGIAPASNS
jgi:PKD domain